MRAIKFTALLSVLALGSGNGQSCFNQAQRTITQAVRLAAARDFEGAHRLLERAEQECPASFAVRRNLADTYRLLGEQQKADEQAAIADRLDPRKQIINGAPEPIAEKTLVGEKWALVMGVGKFQHPEIHELEYAAKDAKDIASALLDSNIGRFRDDGLHVRLLTDQEATLSNLRAEINYIAKNAREEDIVVFYISSHGTSAADDFAAKADGQTGYVITYDTDTNNLYGSAFPMEELKRVVVDRLRARRVVTLLDTCFSGDTVRWAKGGKALTIIPSTTYQGIAQGSGRVLIVSSQGTEQSWEGSGNSYFTKSLIDALKQKNGLATITDVYAQLRTTVPYIVKKEKNAEQHPMMWPEGRTFDIVIGTPVQ